MAEWNSTIWRDQILNVDKRCLLIKSRRGKLENWTKPIFNILVASDFRHRVSTISLARCRHVYPRRNIIQIFSPSLAAKFFLGKTRFPFQMTAHRLPARVLFARVNGRKLPKIGGNGRAGVAPPDEHRERKEGWAGAIVPFTAFSKASQNYTGRTMR